MHIKTRPHKLTKKVPKALKELGISREWLWWDDEYTNNDLSKKDRKLREKWAKQKERLGFDSRETWNLDITIAFFVYPRLKYFRENMDGFYPSGFNSIEEWQEVLDKMLKAFEYIITDKELDTKGNEEYFQIDNEIQEGLDLFGEYFRCLWS